MTPKGGARQWSAVELRECLQALSDHDFTQLIADLWHRQGWTVDIADQSNEIDIRARKTTPYPKKALIQTVSAAENQPLGVTAIDELASLKRREQCTDESIIVTLGSVTDAAETRARTQNVTVIDGEELVTLIETVSGYDIVDHYTAQSTKTDTRDSPGDLATDADKTYRRSQSTERAETFTTTPSPEDDFATYQEATEYAAQQALERATTTVELSPADAAELGVFEGIQWDVVNAFEDQKQELAFMRDDLHLTQDNVLFVEDLTEYAPRAAIAGRPQGRVAGMIRPDVADDAWLASNGAAALQVQSIVDQIHETVARTVVQNQAAEENVEVSRSRWTYVIVSGMMAWIGIATLVIAPTSVGGPLFTAILVATWVGLPLGLLADASRTGILIARPKTTSLVVLASLIPWLSVLAGGLYLYQRQATNWTPSKYD